MSRIKIQIGTTWSLPFWLAGKSFSIVSATDATPVVVATNGNHGFADSAKLIAGGNLNANGAWVAENVTANTVALTSSAATGLGTIAGGLIAQTINATGGTIEFTEEGATWAEGESIVMQNGLLVGAFEPTFEWIDIASGYFTLSLTAEETFGLTPGIYLLRIFYEDSSDNMLYYLEETIEVTYDLNK